MAEIVNLRKQRKAKARVADESKATENRVKFGRTKQERDKQAAEQALDLRRIEGHRLTRPDGKEP